MTLDLTPSQQQKMSFLTTKLKQLPMLPTVVSRMMILRVDSNSFQQDILKLIEEDPTFAARVIQLANSAFSHPSIPILTIKDAVVRMGSKSIANLVTSLSVLKVFMPSTDGQRNLWIHAIQVAVAAKQIALLSKHQVISPEEAYLCGLMHDIGRFVMFSESPEELARVDESNWKDPKELVEVERELFGYDHAEIGWKAAQSWQMPELVTNVIKYHHQYHFKESTIPSIKRIGRIIRIIQMADFFSIVMLTTANFQALEGAEIRQQINQRCIVSSWPETPIKVVELEEVAKEIYSESEVLVNNLGLGPMPPSN